MLDVCAVCGEELTEEGISVGVGSMLFHRRCLPALPVL